MDASPNNRFEAQRLLEIANKYLIANDLTGSKRFAERALESDPLLDGVDQLLAVVDVLLASQRRLNNQPDWYSILQLPPPSSPSSLSNQLEIKRSYRHLTFLLSPNRNKYLFADTALRMVFDAYTFLSAQSDRFFWTWCPYCCHVFEYDRAYVKRMLRCMVCKRAFHAGEMGAAPPIVPGTEMYYCVWGFFPLGFPGCGFGNEGRKERALNAVPVNVGNASGEGESSRKRGVQMRNKKVVAKKSVGNYERKRDLFGESDSEVEELESGGGAVAAAEEGEGIANFEIDLEATEDLLSNLHDDLSFV